MSEALEKRLEHHRRTKHDISTVSTYLKELVYGGIDGIITTFAVVAGFTGAQSGDTVTFSIVTVLLFGLANLFADASSMGLGNFLSLKSEKDYYKEQKTIEEHELAHDTGRETSETIQILVSKGFTQADAEKMTDLYKKNPQYWTEFMMHYELELPNPEGENPVYTGLATFLSFLVFGFIPLIPYLIIDVAITAFSYSVIFTLFALVLLGVLRWYVTKVNLVRAIFETVLLGSISAGIAYLVGYFFRG